MHRFIHEQISLHFLEKNASQKNAILFIHGNSHSLRSFNGQIESPLLSDFRLIAIDLPGHGESSKGTYSIRKFSCLINAFIKSLALEHIVIVGHSLGGHIALNILKTGLKPRGLFLFGTPPLKNPFDPSAFLVNAKVETLRKLAPTRQEIVELVEELKYSGDDKAVAVEDFLKTDPIFRQEILADLINGIHEDEVQLIINSSERIFFLLAMHETLINNNYVKHECFSKAAHIDFLELDAGHSPHVEKAELFNETLLKFCEKVFSEV
jgi:pimeloyl-ACP methyl ester carboxylesterase